MFNAIVVTVCYALTHVLIRPKSQATLINIVFFKKKNEICRL